MKIEVIGTDCPTCKASFETVKKIVVELSIDAEVIYIKDLKKMIDMGMMTSPILVIDDAPVLSGRGFTEENIRKVFAQKNGDKQEFNNGGCSSCTSCGCGK